MAVPSAPLDHLRSGAGGHSGDGGAKSLLARFTSLLRVERRDIALILVYAIGYGLMSLAVPIAVETLVGTVAFGSLMQPVVSLMVLLAAGLAFAAVMRGYQFYVVELLLRRIFARAAFDVAHRMPRVSIERFPHGSPAELVNRFFDAITVEKAAGMLLVDGLSILLEALLGMLLLAFYHPFLAAFDLFLVLGILFVLFVLGRGGPTAFVEASKEKFAVAAWLDEIAHHPIAFTSAGWTRYATERASDVVRRYLVKRSKRFRVVLRQIVGTYSLQVFANTALLGIGGYLVIQRQLTIGQLVASNLIVAAVVEGFTKFGKQIEAFYELLAGLDKLGQLTDLPLEREGGGPAPQRSGPASVEISGLRYDVEGQTIVDRLDLVLGAGTRTLVVGREGSGKSVFAELLFGLRTPTSGVIRIDETDTRSLSLEGMRSMVSLARDVSIFDGTIAENVSGGSALCDPETMRAAIEAVGLSREIEALPEGLATPIRDRYGPLSSGQRRRLALARCIAQRPRVLVVDETLDGLDDHHREHVRSALSAPDAPWTLLVLAKDDRTSVSFTRVLRMDHGHIFARTNGAAS
ncbi:ABC transporter ATP-binding protein [soil metagenome]